MAYNVDTLRSLKGRTMKLNELETLLSSVNDDPDSYGVAYTDEDYGENCDMIHSMDEIESDDPCIDGMNLFEVFFSNTDGSDDRDGTKDVVITEVNYFDGEKYIDN